MANDIPATNGDEGLVRLEGYLGGADNFQQIMCKEVSCTESLLTPGLQTTAIFQSQIYGNKVFKDWDLTKGQRLYIRMYDKLAGEFAGGGVGREMIVRQRIYRLDSREFQPINVGQTEEMTFHACDDTLLEDAKTLVSKSWKCTAPDEVVKYVLTSCLNAQNPDVQKATPPRDYIAESIHPFQVIAQMTNVSLDGDDPSFVHYMTYGEINDWTPKHHFRSLKDLSNGTSKETYVHSEAGALKKADYNDPTYRIGGEKMAIHFMFPCDYDLLSDLLNGLDEKGQNINAVSTFEPDTYAGQWLNGNNKAGCIKNGNLKMSMTNKASAKDKGGCANDVEKHLLKRQARMGLLEKDKIALRLIVPWNPNLHAGDIITFNWYDKWISGVKLYGSGDYLIASMTHRVQTGGYATTTLDCVSQTVGRGEV